MKRAAVLFDVFGTLVQFGVQRHPFRTLMSGLSLSRSQALAARRRLMTRTVPSILAAARLLADEGLGQPAEFHVGAAEQELEEHLAGCRPADGAVPLLRDLREDGFALAVVSNLASVYVPALERLGIDELVDHATYSCEVGLAKPDAAIYRFTLDKLGIGPRHATMVGNSLRADVAGAQRAGLHAIWITANDDPEHVCLARLADLRSVLS